MANKNGPKQTVRERWERSNLEMLVTVRSVTQQRRRRKNERRAHHGRGCGHEQGLQEHLPAPKSVYITLEELEVFRLHGEMTRVFVAVKGFVGQVHAAKNRERIEE